MASGGIAFAGSQLVFAGYSGTPFSNRAFNLRLNLQHHKRRLLSLATLVAEDRPKMFNMEAVNPVPLSLVE
jgi:hypothetical protein